MIVEGRVERILDGVLSGWAWAPDEPERRVRIQVRVDDDIAASAVANQPRRSLAAAGIGDGAHGFQLQLPEVFTSPGPHRLAVRAEGTFELPAAAAGFTVSCSDKNGPWAGASFTVDPAAPSAPPAAPRGPRPPRLTPGGRLSELVRSSYAFLNGRPWFSPAFWIVLLSIVWVYVHLVGVTGSVNGDEAYSILYYITPGPSGFLFGHYQPNDQVLYEALAWVTSSVLGAAVPVYRLANVIPAALAVVVLAGWAWRRLGRWTAAVIALLFTLAPELLSETIQARGYGLTMLAMAAMVVCAAEMTERGPRPALTFGLGASMFVGVATDSVVALGALGVFVALLTQRRLRGSALKAGVSAAVAFLIVFSPLLGQMRNAFGSDYLLNPNRPHAQAAPARPAVPIDYTISGPALTLAPTAQMLDRGTVALECTGCVRGSDVWAYGTFQLLLVIAGAVVLLLRRRTGLMLVLALPPLIGFTLLAAGRIYVADRFVLFELVPLLTLMAIGAISVATWLRDRWLSRANTASRLLGSGLFGILVLFGSYRIVHLADSWTDVPIQNYKAASQIAIDAGVRPVVTDSRRIYGFYYYLGAHGIELVTDPSLLRRRLCGPGPIVFIHEALIPDQSELRCLAHDGAARFVLPQSTGTHFEVWVRSGTAAINQSGSG